MDFHIDFRCASRRAGNVFLNLKVFDLYRQRDGFLRVDSNNLARHQNGQPGKAPKKSPLRCTSCMDAPLLT